MRPRSPVLLLLALLLLLVATSVLWRLRQPRDPVQQALNTLEELHVALANPDPTSLLALLAPPTALAAQTPTERAEFLRKALQNELSPAGIDELRRHARCGPLPEVFPAEAANWAYQAGVPPDQCVAFRLGRTNGLRAEVVIYTNSKPFRIVRCNDVR